MDGAKFSLSKYICAHKGEREREGGGDGYEAEKQILPIKDVRKTGNLRERDHWGDQDVDGRIILRWIFR